MGVFRRVFSGVNQGLCTCISHGRIHKSIQNIFFSILHFEMARHINIDITVEKIGSTRKVDILGPAYQDMGA